MRRERAVTTLKSAFCIPVVLAVIIVTVPASTHSEPAQPSPTNNVLYLHNDNIFNKGCWMSTDKCETVSSTLS